LAIAGAAGWLRPHAIPSRTMRDLGSEALPLGALNVVGLLNAKLDSVIVAGLIGTAAFGRYAVALRTFDLLLVAPTVLTVVVFPMLVRAHATHPDHYRDLVRRFGEQVTDLGCIAVVGSLLGAPTIVRIIGGAGFHSAVLPTRLLAVAGLGAFLTAWFAQLVVVQQLQRRLLQLSGVMLVVNVVATVVMTESFGIPGAAAGTLVVEVVGTVALAVLLERRQPLGLAHLLIRPVPVLAAFGAIAGLLAEQLGAADLLAAIVAVVVCAAAWVGADHRRVPRAPQPTHDEATVHV
jgi:O-antigen/teichoic acid export membrane protein